MTLKTNQPSSDPRLDRIPFFDERSRDYPIRGAIPERLLRSYTWRCLDWHNQGEEGACVYFCMGHELASRPVENRGLSDAYLRDGYHRAQHDDSWPGCSLGQSCQIEAGPQYDGTAVLSGLKIARDDGYIGEFRWAFGIEDLIFGLGYSGPAVLGLWWMQGMFTPDENGFIWPTGARMGGHAICARGVRIVRLNRTQPPTIDNIDFDKSWIRLRNSWGRGWGKDGDCFITLKSMDTLLRDQGEAALITERFKVVR